jgi:hypothetical protein
MRAGGGAAMTLFDFVTVMVSMILALSLGHVLDGIAHLYKTRERVKWSLPHTLWMGAIVLTLINHWWALWDFRDINWNYASFLYILIAPVALSFAVNLIAPERDGNETYDMGAQFDRVRQPFAVAFCIYVLAMWFDGAILAGQDPLAPLGLLHIPALVATAVGFFSKGRAINIVISLIAIATLMGIGLTRLITSLS